MRVVAFRGLEALLRTALPVVVCVEPEGRVFLEVEVVLEVEVCRELVSEVDVVVCRERLCGEVISSAAPCPFGERTEEGRRRRILATFKPALAKALSHEPKRRRAAQNKRWLLSWTALEERDAPV